MKTKDRATICPTQKTTFLPGWKPFYTKTQEFCGKDWLFCRFSSSANESFAPKCGKFQGPNAVRPYVGPPSPVSRGPLAENRRFQIQDSRFRKRSLTAHRQSTIENRQSRPESRVPLAENRRFQIQDSRFRKRSLTAHRQDSKSRALRPIVNRQSKIGNSAPSPEPRVPIPVSRVPIWSVLSLKIRERVKNSCPKFEFVLPPAPRATFTWEMPGRRFSTGCLRGIRAEHLSCASKTRTRNVPSRNTNGS